MNIKNVVVALCLMIAGISCSKIKELAPEAGAPLPYPLATSVTTEKLIDSLPALGIYRTIYRKSHAQGYVDSVRNAVGKSDLPFTLFVPTDAAWQRAGYDQAKAQSLPVNICDELILYLAVSGRILPDSAVAVSGGTMLYPVIPAGSYLSELNGTIDYHDQMYTLNLAFANQQVFLNGTKVGSSQSAVTTIDGAVYLIDSLIEHPAKTVYEILAADTSYSFYLAALEKSSALYTQYKVGLSPGDRNEEIMGVAAVPFFNYLQDLKRFVPRNNVSLLYQDGYIVFAPDNNAFRKVGLATIDELERYIETSYITTDAYRNIDHAIPRYTNVDSALVYSFMKLYFTANADPGLAFYTERKITNVNQTWLYTTDLRWNPVLQQDGVIATTQIDFYDWTTFDENTFEFAPNLTKGTMKWLFREESGRIAMRRGDLPAGPVAYIVPEHANVTALNGVVHRIDNLLLSHP